ncbi:RelA/SpoT family protein [Spirochaetota bacterium]
MTEFELKIRSRDINTLINLIKGYNENADIDIIERAYKFAEEAHKDYFRLSGEPYIIHPLEVAIILADLKLDTTTMAAAILHDIVEDTGITLETIKENFNDEIAQLVNGVTKISSIKNRSRATAQAETLRKMLLATIKDVRVIIIKLADKLHNMRTIFFQPPVKQTRIARATLEIYAPIARRLGISKISSELEDLSFHVLHPREYDDIDKMIAQRKSKLKEYIETVKNILATKLKNLGIECEITGRAKHYYSIYRKMQIKHLSFDDIYDIRAIRIITNEIKDCYGALGVIHTLWSPITGRFKDYVAVPKSNMYQSIHTTVIGPDGMPLEVQIRTDEMHETAEVGIAAHWEYKENLLPLNVDYQDLTLLQNINKLYSDSSNTREFMKGLKMDLYEDEIFVFTPKGKIIKLAKGATPIDFAYAIHTEVGHHTSGAKVNNKMVPLKTKLSSGDIVEILTTKKSHPSDSWIKFVASSTARYKIRTWLRKNKKIKTREVSKAKLDENKLLKDEKTAKVSIPVDQQIKIKKFKQKHGIGVKVEGESNVLIKLSQCCQPIPGDDVTGFITRGRGITIHKKNCPSLIRLKNEKERFIKIVWEGTESNLYPIKLVAEGIERPNLLKDIINELSLCDTNILKMDGEVREKELVYFKFVLEVSGNSHLNEIIKKIKKVKNITDVYKLNEKVVLK